MAGKRRVDHKAVAEFKRKHPEMSQKALGKHFGLTQSQVSKILRAEGVDTNQHHGGFNGSHPKALKCKPGMTEEQFLWEKRLSELGLGMDRGLRINNKRILYGEQDKSVFEVNDNCSTAK